MDKPVGNFPRLTTAHCLNSNLSWSAGTSAAYQMHAFNLPPTKLHRTRTRSLSERNGKTICRPGNVFAPQRRHVGVLRATPLSISQKSGDTNQDASDSDPPAYEIGKGKDSVGNQLQSARLESPSIWLVVIESAVQISILALAIAGSIQTRRRALIYLAAILSVPQFALVVSRFWRRLKPGSHSLPNSADSAPCENSAPAPTTENAPWEGREDSADESRGELSLVQSSVISNSIRTAVAEEVDELRFAYEQIEQASEQRQQARNVAIAEAIASLDGSLRSLRRTVETRNQVESSAPFALVSELEIVKSRLKQTEQEKVSLELRLRAAEDNFEEAKRQGQRARREADDAASRELLLRTDLATASSRLLRLEEVTERLERAEQRNDELTEQIVSGTREQEGLRQSAADAERRVMRVENISRILGEKVREVTGRSPSQVGQEDGDGPNQSGERQFWPQRPRGKRDLRPDSVVYQELLREQNAPKSSKWPLDPLGAQTDREDSARLKKMPDDGGFGSGDVVAGRSALESGSESKLLSPENGSETIFSFSRGEFGRSGVLSEGQKDGADGDQSSPSANDTQISVDCREPSDLPVSRPDGASPEPVAKTDRDLEQPISDDTVRVFGTTSATGTRIGNHAEEAAPPQGESDVKLESVPGSASFKDSPPQASQGPASSEDFSEAEPSRDMPSSDSGGSKPMPQDKLGESPEPRERGVDQSGTMVSPVASMLKEEDTRGMQSAGPELIGDETLERTYDPSWESANDSTLNTADQLKVVTAPKSAADSAQPVSSAEKEPQERRDTPTTGTGRQVPDISTKDIASKDLVKAGNTASYLENLSPVTSEVSNETVEDAIRSARELVKKARARGLALAQADHLFQKASAKLENALNRVDDRSEVEADLGGCLLAWAKTSVTDPVSHNRLSRALQLLTSSLEAQPDRETVLFNAGLCNCLVASTSTEEKAIGHYEKACEMYERLQERNGRSRIACFNCALAYVSLGRLSLGNGSNNSVKHFERAAALFQRSLELKPGDSKAISYLDDCKRQLDALGSV